MLYIIVTFAFDATFFRRTIRAGNRKIWRVGGGFRVVPAENGNQQEIWEPKRFINALTDTSIWVERQNLENEYEKGIWLPGW